jgi:hypothetical protein
MSKTPFSKKVEILAIFYATYRDNDELTAEWKDFMLSNDIGLPASFMSWQGMAKITDIGKPFIEDTWNIYCLALGIDPDDRWDTMEQTFEASAANVS